MSKLLLLLCTLLVLTGCSGGGGKVPVQTAGVSMSFRVARDFQTRAVSDIKAIKVSISGPYMDAMTASFAFDPQQPEVTRTYQVPIGTDRKFHIDALDASAKALYIGETTQDVVIGTNKVAVELLPNIALGQATLQMNVPNIPASLKGYLAGLGFSPYLDGQDPNLRTQISAQQIRDRLSIIKPWCTAIRYYGSTDGMERIGPIARQEFGMNVMAGVWLGRDKAANDQQVANAIATARANGCDSICVGSEVLLRGDLPEGNAQSQAGDGTLIGYIKQVKAAVAVPVTYSDVYSVIHAHPAVVAECEEMVLVNIYGYWEGVEAKDALTHLKTQYGKVVAAYPDKKIVIGEVGWPTAGNTVGLAEPSPGNARRFFRDVLLWTHDNHIPGYWFAAFDENWKAAAEGSQGAHWGIWLANGGMKPEYHEVMF